MEEKETMIQIDNVSKIYKLGEIGGTTLTETFQRLFAKIRHKEDPTKKIGAKNYNKGEKFKALDGINLTIKKGERVGIIGHNGAGKSTLLKLICRITAPTEGEIGLNGRITSMLEVGTGFHPELTGRENIYMNGAILGMTKKEIDGVVEDIIDFSEVREFIDTPVKRYSSGMYVKLAFSVAAHLKSEIMIMDEVLAVGDMAFQNKCLTKMRSVSEEDGRTILYVSHNMNTIRKLCDRVVVLDHGHVVFDGDIEEGIAKYLKNDRNDLINYYDGSVYGSSSPNYGKYIKIKSFSFFDVSEPVFAMNSPIRFMVEWTELSEIKDLRVRLEIYSNDFVPVGMCESSFISNNKSDLNNKKCVFFTSFYGLVSGTYKLRFSFFSLNEFGKHIGLDDIKYITFKIDNYFDNKTIWSRQYWGSVRFDDIKILE